jgi:hypothetical protein
MSLLGKGALAIWHDITADGEIDYNEWHSKEHLLERVGVPGFLRGHRLQAVSGAPRYLNLYEVRDLATLTSQPYLDRLNHPTPWTQRALGHFRDNNRTLCRVVASIGNGVCGNLLTMQLAAAAERGDQLRAWLSEEIMPALVRTPGILGAHYLEGDVAASRTETEEKRLRLGADAIADRVILVGGYDPGALETVGRTALSPAALAAHGAERSQLAVYRLLHCITEADLPSRGAPTIDRETP